MIHICQRRIIFTFSHSHISFPQTNTIRAIHQRISKHHIQNLTNSNSNSNVLISKRFSRNVSFSVLNFTALTKTIHNHKFISFLQKSGQTISRRRCHNTVKNNVPKNNQTTHPQSQSKPPETAGGNSNIGVKEGQLPIEEPPKTETVINLLKKLLTSKFQQYSQKFAFKKVTGVLLLSVWLFYFTKQQFYELHLRTVARKGFSPKLERKIDSRIELESKIRKLVLRPDYLSNIFVVYGQKGVGKTTMMKKMVIEMNQSEKSEKNENKDERGVIYVEAESNPHKFVDNILNAIGYDVDWKYSLNNIRRAFEHQSPAQLSAKG